MATVTVPGVGGSIISYTFNTPDNTALAQAIASALITASVGGTLNVQAYNGGLTPPTVSGDTNQLVVAPTSAGGIVFTPAGYTFVADSTAGGAFTVAGARNFIGGSGSLTIFNAVAGPVEDAVIGSVDSVVAGDGNDLFGLIPGSTYDAAGGNGNDTFNANGSGTVSSGAGNNLIFVGGAAGDNNLVLSHGHDTVALGAGTATVATYGNAPLIFGGPGGMEVFSNGSVNETVVGSSGPETIFSATSGVYFLGTSTSEYIGNTSTSSTIVGTTGQETMFGGGHSHEVVFN
ncbi:MAG: hypothetical protein ACREF3_08050, partial [Acetobacteraceae bacterium]